MRSSWPRQIYLSQTEVIGKCWGATSPSHHNQRFQHGLTCTGKPLLLCLCLHPLELLTCAVFWKFSSKVSTCILDVLTALIWAIFGLQSRCRAFLKALEKELGIGPCLHGVDGIRERQRGKHLSIPRRVTTAPLGCLSTLEGAPLRDTGCLGRLPSRSSMQWGSVGTSWAKGEWMDDVQGWGAACTNTQS